jgi:hypothetical protein
MIALVLFLITLSGAGAWFSAVFCVRHFSGKGTRSDIAEGRCTASAVVRDRLDRAAREVARSALALVAGRYRAVRGRRRAAPAMSRPAQARQGAPRRTASPAGTRKVPAPPPFERPAPRRETSRPGPGDPGSQGQIVALPPALNMAVEYFGGFEAPDISEHLNWFEVLAEFMRQIGDACRDYSDTQVYVTGLDPACAMATAEAAECIENTGHDVMLAWQHFLVVYQEMLDMVESGKVIPYQARQFFGQPDAVRPAGNPRGTAA